MQVELAAPIPQTPCLLLDKPKVTANVARLRARLDAHGASLRPHMKTAKSIDVARLVLRGPNPSITVSTLKEAEYFASHGITDILYAVGIAPAKLARVAALRARGIDLKIIADSLEAARAVGAFSRQTGDAIPVLIEIDCDGHRSGVAPHDHALLLEIAAALNDGARVAGIIAHAGSSYGCSTASGIEDKAEEERAGAVTAAQALLAAGFECPIVSVGSTPTSHFARSLDGITEVRAGVFIFFDLVMTGVGVCTTDDVAISVLASVIGHQPDKGWILVDAGWMAMSRDRGTAKQAIDQGYGLVCDIKGRPYGDLIMIDANQEHGILALRPGSTATLPALAPGDLVRILPNHACATASQFDGYHVLDGEAGVRAFWPRINGW